MTPALIVAAALALLHTPYHHQGRLPGVGLDCVGAFVVPAAQCGVPSALAFLVDRRYDGYGRQPQRALLEACAEYLDEIPKANAGELADILLMRFDVEPQHFALITSIEPLRILHASERVGRVVEHGLDRAWRERVVRAYRYQL